MRATQFSMAHKRAELLIPWMANGTLAGDTAASVREHLESCAQCREDYETQVRLREGMRAEDQLVFAAEPSYQKLLARIRTCEVTEMADGVLPQMRPRHPRRAAMRVSPAVRWLAAAAILEAFALGLGGWMWHASAVTPAAPYRTLTSASPSYDSGARIRAVFRPNLTLADLQGVLRSVDARIIAGPTDHNVYTLGFAQPPASAAVIEKRIATLRANPAVLFAEPVTDGVH